MQPPDPTGEVAVHLDSEAGIPYAAVRTHASAARRRWLWIAAFAVIGLLLAATAYAVTGNPAVPEGGPLADGQARSVDRLLDVSTAGRAQLLTAIDDINACHVTGSTISFIRAAARARMDLAGQVARVAVSDLPAGARIKSQLAAAVHGSYAADRAYLEWVLAAGDKCPTHADPAWRKVEAAQAAVHDAKRDFVNTWNPVARKYGLPQRSLTVI